MEDTANNDAVTDEAVHNTTVADANTTTHAPNIEPPPTSQRPFRFLDLPIDVRRVVYDKLNKGEQHLKHLLTKKECLFYHETGINATSLHLTKEFRSEVNHAWVLQGLAWPVTVFCTLATACYLAPLQVALEVARCADKYQSLTDPVPKIALALGTAKFRSNMTGRGKIAGFNLPIIREFFHITLLRLRRRPVVNFRVAYEDPHLLSKHSQHSHHQLQCDNICIPSGLRYDTSREEIKFGLTLIALGFEYPEGIRPEGSANSTSSGFKSPGEHRWDIATADERQVAGVVDKL